MSEQDISQDNQNNNPIEQNEETSKEEVREEVPMQEDSIEDNLEETHVKESGVREVPDADLDNLNNLLKVQETHIDESEEANDSFKERVNQTPRAAILCKAKEHNPNYLSIIHVNEEFYKHFGLSENEIIGKSYDFLFGDLDVGYSSEGQLEYIRLVKSVRDLHQCSIITSLQDHKEESSKTRFKIEFKPITDDDAKNYSIFSFEKMEEEAEEKVEVKSQDKDSDLGLLKNLERALYNERLLREVGYLIVSDLPIQEVAENIAKTLCQYLKTDRCVIHDYRSGGTSFIVEYNMSYAKPMVNGDHSEDGFEKVIEYVNFQNHFYEKFGEKTKRSSLIAVPDIAADSNFSPIQNVCEKFSISSQIAITTSINGSVNGGIYIHQSSQRNWMVDEIELLEMVADQFSLAIDRSESIERVMIANHELLEKTQQLKESLKEEKNMRKMQNEFVALVSHEFKTPLQIIDSTREILVRKLRKLDIIDEAVDKSLDRIKGGIQRMNGLIHSTLNLAQMESGENKIKVEKDIFDLKGFVEEIIEKNSNLSQNKNITVDVNIDALPSEFNGDRKLLDHSVTNIISNAIKYSPNDSKVTVSARRGKDKVLIKVVDQGIGIPKDDLANVGQKFFRAKNSLAVAGTGIGIYLTKYFIELHGGSVLIESEVNVGTSVSVVIPR